MSGSAALLELELLSLGMPTQHREISVCIRVSKTRHVKLNYNLFSRLFPNMYVIKPLGDDHNK